MRKSVIWSALAALTTTAAGLALGGAAFASDPPSPISSPYSPAKLTVNYVGLSQKNTGVDLIVKVSNLVVPHSGSGPYTVVFDLAKGPDVTTTESVSAGSLNSATWSLSLAGTKNTSLTQVEQQITHDNFLSVAEWNYSEPGPTPPLASGGLSPNSLPYGQLPEVPWAGGLPLIAIGVGALGLWQGRRRSAHLAKPAVFRHVNPLDP